MKKFKRGDRVIVSNEMNSDTPVGMTGVFKRYNSTFPGRCVIIRDDGGGWLDGDTKGWSVAVDSLAIYEDIGYEMDA